MWPVLIVVLVVAMMVGPIMIMQPSKGQKRLADLRAKAASLGWHVSASTLKDAEGVPCWFYWLALTEKDSLPALLLLRKNYAHDLHIAQFWSLKTGAEPLPQGLEELLHTLPAGVCAFEINGHGIGVHWNETGGQAALLSFSEELKAWVCARG